MEASKLRAKLTKSIKAYIWVKYQDRLSIATKMEVSRPTIDNYINGKVRNLEFAEKLLLNLKKIKK